MLALIYISSVPAQSGKIYAPNQYRGILIPEYENVGALDQH
jgi:hypothetical protein